MPDIDLLRFHRFTARKTERYSATHNGIYLVEGGRVILRQPQGEEIELKAGDFTLYNSKDLNRSEAAPGYFRALALVFDAHLFTEFKLAHKDQQIEDKQRHFYPFTIQDHSDISQMIKTLVQLVESNAPKYAQKHVALALLSMMLKEEPRVLSIIDEANNLTISQKTIKYIDAHLDKQITLETVAAHLGMSIATLKRRLAAEDVSFSQILKIKRINYAATQLRISHKSIAHIAFESGFKSAAHFTTAFKSINAMTPKDFRNKLRS